MPVGRIQRKLNKGGYADRIGTGAAVLMAGVLEYLAAEMMELAGDAARENKNVRIKPRHVMMAVKKDEELSKLLKDVLIPEAGVLPFIHPILLPKESRTKQPLKASKKPLAETSENNEMEEDTQVEKDNEVEETEVEEIEVEEETEVEEDTVVETFSQELEF